MNRHQKYLYLELMRILACFFVIFNHTGNNGFFLFSQRPWGGLQFWIYMFVSIFCKFSVPVFFAISGALLLSKNDEPLKTLWCRRIARIAGSLLVFSSRLTGECSEGVSQTFHNTFVMINAATIFLSSKYLAVTYEGKLSQWFKKAVFAVGKGTFGIYLWHILVLRLLTRFKIWELFRDKLDLNYMISAFLVCLCVMAVSYGLTWPMQKIPLIRKLVS